MDSLTASDDFSIAFRCQYVHAQGQFRILPIRLHIKGFDRRRVAVNDNRPVKLTGDNGFIGPPEIGAPGCLCALLFEDVEGFVVADVGKGRLHFLENGYIAFQDFEFLSPFSEHSLNDSAKVLLRQIHDVVQVGKGHLRFDHPELRQVAACFRLFGPESGTETVGLSHRHAGCLVVKLAALGQVGFFLKVVEPKEGRCPFAGRRGDDGSVDQSKTAVIQEVPAGFDYLAADSQDRMLACGTEPQVSVVHQKRGSMLFR